MQRALGPWLHSQIEDNIVQAVQKASVSLVASKPAPEQPAATIEAIGRRIDEAMRVAVTKAAAMPPAAPRPGHQGLSEAFGGLAGANETKKELGPKPCMTMKDGSSPKTAHVTMDKDQPKVLQLGPSLESMPSSPSSPNLYHSGSASPPALGSPRGTSRFRSERGETLPRLMSRGSRRTLDTGTSLGAQTQEEGYTKALVVNFRRLIEIKEKLDIIHEVIKATTIALLTLLAVSNGFRLAYDLGFLVCGIALYALHELSHDALDIEDYKRVVGLVGNDGEELFSDPGYTPAVENPNKCVTALSYSATGRRKLMSTLMMCFFVCITGVAWGLVYNVWTTECNWYCALGWSQPGEEWDIEHYATLLLVGTLMLLCHFVYEALYFREFKYIMPSKELRGAKVPWDLDEDGIPPGNLNWLFGLPCVWFSTRQAYEDLRIWVTLASGLPIGRTSFVDKPNKARNQHTVRQVFFEEMAVYALEDCHCAARLRKSLLGSKLYDKQSKRFLRRLRDEEDENKNAVTITMTSLHTATTDGLGTETLVPVNPAKGGESNKPTELGVELLFYDNRSGEVWIPSIPQEAEDDAPLRLRHEASLNKLGRGRSLLGELAH